jgi:hypothetical protein
VTLAQALAADLAATLQQQHQLLPAQVTCLLQLSLQHLRLLLHLLQRPLRLQLSRQLQHQLLMQTRTRHQRMQATVQQQIRLHLQLPPLVLLLLVVMACRAMEAWVTALVLLVQAQLLMHLLHLQLAATVMHSEQVMDKML